MNLTCYPKINLGLRVHPLDTLGYHPIQSIFLYAVGELKDEIKVSNYHCTDVSVPGHEIKNTENLVYKAHLALLKNGVRLNNQKIIIQKKIPTGAGLGGGSSNAGVYLRTFGSELKHLDKIAKNIGADIPFFLQNKACLVSGHGEILEPIEDKLNIPAIIVTPNIHCETKSIFKIFDELPQPVWEYEPHLIISYLRSASSKINDHLSNDLERAACTVHPKLRSIFSALRQILEEQCFYCGMSGSGSAFFALFKSPDLSQAALNNLREAGYQAYQTKFCSEIKHTANFPFFETDQAL